MRPDDSTITRLVAAFIAEDVGRGDITTQALIAPDLTGTARIETRGPCVLAGIDVARACFAATGGAAMIFEALAGDGDRLEAGAVVARVTGPLGAILSAERTALNLMQRMSGVATLTARYVDAVAGTPARIVDTRKTTPGLRLLEKYAVRAGGGDNHRFGLDDGILIKDNHLAALGGDISEAVARARAGAPHGLRVEVEVGDLDMLDAAMAAGADVVLLDNMDPAMVAQAVARAGGKVILEASGGITLDNVRAYAMAGVDLISVGALTHSAPAVDLALEVEA